MNDGHKFDIARVCDIVIFGKKAMTIVEFKIKYIRIQFRIHFIHFGCKIL